MAINLETQYPGKVAPSSPSYPYGEARNITVPGDGTGTPWEAAIVNDLVGFQQALLSAGSVVPSGTPDQVGASQYLTALKKITNVNTDIVTYSSGTAKYPTGDAFTGQFFSLSDNSANITSWRVTGDNEVEVVATGGGTATVFQLAANGRNDGNTFRNLTEAQAAATGTRDGVVFHVENDDELTMYVTRGGALVVLTTFRKFDDLAKYNPTAPEFVEKPVFSCFASANFDLTQMLYPCKTGTKSVLDVYKIGATAADDAFNVGGTANHRVVQSFVVKTAIAGQFNELSKTGGVLETTAVSSPSWDAAVGAPSTSAGEAGFANGAHGFSDRNTWNVPNGENIEFVATEDSEILFFKSGSGSTAVEIYTDETGAYALKDTISLLGSGPVRYRFQSGTKVRINNTVVGNCYIIGVDVDELQVSNLKRTYDAVKYWREDDYVSGTAYWIGPGEGANDFAWKDTGGRFFGSFHGGHSAETVTLNIGGESLASGAIVAGEFRSGKTATLRSVSTLNSDSATYTCLTDATYFAGGHRIYGEVLTASPQSLSEMFMGMTVADARFDSIEMPVTLDLSGTSVSDETELGDVNYGIQYDPERRHAIRTDVTRFDNRFAQKPGPYIQTRAGDYKFYYNPLEEADQITAGAKFEIYHQFFSDSAPLAGMAGEFEIPAGGTLAGSYASVISKTINRPKGATFLLIEANLVLSDTSTINEASGRILVDGNVVDNKSHNFNDSANPLIAQMLMSKLQRVSSESVTVSVEMQDDTASLTNTITARSTLTYRWI